MPPAVDSLPHATTDYYPPGVGQKGYSKRGMDARKKKRLVLRVGPTLFSSLPPHTRPLSFALTFGFRSFAARTATLLIATFRPCSLSRLSVTHFRASSTAKARQHVHTQDTRHGAMRCMVLKSRALGCRLCCSVRLMTRACRAPTETTSSPASIASPVSSCV